MVKDDEKQGLVFFAYDIQYTQGACQQVRTQAKASTLVSKPALGEMEVDLPQRNKRPVPHASPPSAPSLSVLPSPPPLCLIWLAPAAQNDYTILRVRKWCVFDATPRCASLHISFVGYVLTCLGCPWA